MENLPVSTTYLEELKDQLQRDSVGAKVMQFCAEGWPAHNTKELALKPYWDEQAHLTVHDGKRLNIPSTMRSEILTKVHQGHQGVVKCREWAQQSV